MSKTKKDPRPANPEIYEPDPDYDTKIDISRAHPETPETAGEAREARRMAVKGESARGRTDISLDTLREKTKTRRFDAETPREINEINFFESPEIQEERFDALRDVTVVMLANIIHANQNIEQQLDLSNFENVAQLRSHMAGIRPGPAENAAFHKILELQQHPDSEVSRHFASQWGSLAGAARQIERDMRSLETADLRSRNAPEEKGRFSKAVNFVKKHPIAFGIALAAGAYGLYKIFSGIREKLSPSLSAEKKEGGTEKKTGFMGWLIGAGAAILAIFGLGRFLGKDGVKKFFKEKMGWDLSASRTAQTMTLISQGKFKEAWETAWKGVDENAEFHGKMAKIISDDTRAEVTGKTIFELKDEEFDDFMESSSQWGDELSVSVGEIAVLGTVAKPFLDSRRKNEEQIAVRGFLKKHEAAIRKIMQVREETTLEEVFQKLHVHLTGQPSGAAIAAVAGGAAASRALSETSERDRAIEKLPAAKKARAIENEQVLSQKINFAYINQMNEAVTDRERMIRELLAKSLKPEEREDVEEKLATLLSQKDQLAELIEKHNSAYLAYRDALNQDTDEETLILRFTELIETKELLEEHFDDIFAREGWQVLEALAATHALRFIKFAHRRWLKHGDIRNEKANYLFSKYMKRLSIERIRDSLRELRKRKPARAKIPSMAALKRKNNGLFREMNDFIEEIHSGSQGLAAEGVTKEHFAKMDRLEQKIGEQNRHLDDMWRQKNEALKAAIAKGDKRKQSALLKEIQELGNERVRLEFGSAKQIGGMFDRWSKAFKGVGGKPDARQKGVAAFRGFFVRAMRKQREAEKLAQAASASRVWMRKGKLVFLGASVVLGGEILADEKTSRTKAYKQAGLSALPVVGTYMDFYSAFSGKEKMTGRKLDAADRFISGAFGVAGLATDALTVFGIGIVGRGILVGLKASRGMGKAARVAKAIEAAKAAKTAQKAEAAAGAYKGMQVLEQAGKWGFRVSLGGALGVPAYMAFTQQAELDVSDEFMKEVIQPAGIAAAPEAPPESGAREAA